MPCLNASRAGLSCGTQALATTEEEDVAVAVAAMRMSNKVLLGVCMSYVQVLLCVGFCT